MNWLSLIKISFLVALFFLNGCGAFYNEETCLLGIILQDKIDASPPNDFENNKNFKSWFKFRLTDKDWEECVIDKKVNGKISKEATFACFRQKGYKFDKYYWSSGDHSMCEFF